MEQGSAPLLRNIRFLQLWIGQGFSFVGDAISMVAMIILVVELTGSASAVGGVLVARLIPTLAGPLIGVLADRLDRRVIVVAADISRAALMLGIVFVRDIFILYALFFLVGVARTFFNPTIRAAFPSVVGSGDLTRANGIISGTFSASIALGPALGGLLVATVGVEAAFLIDAGTYLISAAFLSRIPLPRPEQGGSGGFGTEFKAGLGYLARARVPLVIVVGAFFLILTMNTTVPAEVFLARETFGAGDTGYGLLVALWGGGMVLGSALIALLGDRINLLAFYFIGILISAIALTGAGLSPTFVLALAALTAGGAANGIDNVTTDTILQKRVPEELLGRVFSVRFLTLGVGEVLAYAAGGLLVDQTGPRITYVSMGAATAAVGLLILLALAAPTHKPTPGNPDPQ